MQTSIKLLYRITIIISIKFIDFHNITTFCFLSPAGKFATLDTMHALCLPLGASISLLVMFFFFDSMQMLFAVCTASEYEEFFLWLPTDFGTMHSIDKQNIMWFW